jgi:Kef-type K+ transport system membrane component KefB
MTEFPILRDLGFIIVAGSACVLAARALRVPPIVAYMVAGLVLGPLTGLVVVSEPVDLIAEVGIALLLFLVGLELSVRTVKDVGTVALIAGGGQVVLTAAGGYGLARLLGFDSIAAGVLAASVTLSSTVVAVKMLAQRRELTALHGRIAVGVLLVQDLVAVLIITLIGALGRSGDLSAADVGQNLLMAFGGVAALTAAAVLAAVYFLQRLLHPEARSTEIVFVWSLAWCFLFIIAAEALHLSVEIGAFVAGVSLAQLRVAHELRRRVEPLVSFFVAVFFVTLGIRMHLTAAMGQIAAAAAFTVFVLLFKPATLLALIPRAGYGERTAFFGAVTLAQVSEFSFIIAALAARDGLISPDLLSLISLVGLVTIGVSAFAIRSCDQLYGAVRRTGMLAPIRAAPETRPSSTPQRVGHIIVIGMNTLGRRLVEAFAARGENVIAIDTDPSKLAGLTAETVVGNADHPAVLEEAGLETAKLLVSALQIEEANNLLAYRAHEAGVPSSIHAFDPSLIDDLERIGADHLMVSKHDGIRQVVAALQLAGVID